MSDESTAELQDPASWDFDRAEKRPAVKNARSVVSVALAAQEFERIAKCAEQLDMRVSAFIRKAALDRAFEQSGLARLSSYSGTAQWTVFTEHSTATTRVAPSRLSGAISPDKEAVATS